MVPFSVWLNFKFHPISYFRVTNSKLGTRKALACTSFISLAERTLLKGRFVKRVSKSQLSRACGPHRDVFPFPVALIGKEFSYSPERLARQYSRLRLQSHPLSLFPFTRGTDCPRTLEFSVALVFWSCCWAQCCSFWLNCTCDAVSWDWIHGTAPCMWPQPQDVGKCYNVGCQVIGISYLKAWVTKLILKLRKLFVFIKAVSSVLIGDPFSTFMLKLRSNCQHVLYK